MKILIADDDCTSLAILSTILQKRGYEPVETVNGLEAWNALRSPDSPSIAVIDWMMPEMDGLEVVRRVRAVQTEQPPYIIILTAKGGKTDVITGLEAGANDYLAKPFDTGELYARIEVGKRMIELQAALIKSRESLAHLAAHDSLTGMLNRKAIIDRLSVELKRSSRDGGTLAVGMLDIDHFKKVNDTYGHPTGDEALCEVAKILHKNQREYDAVGRLGGEEFLMIMPLKDEVNPEALFDRLRSKISDAKIRTKNGELSLTVSIGVARASAENKTDEILCVADKALYMAKNQGRNRVVYAACCENSG